MVSIILGRQSQIINDTRKLLNFKRRKKKKQTQSFENIRKIKKEIWKKKILMSELTKGES